MEHRMSKSKKIFDEEKSRQYRKVRKEIGRPGQVFKSKKEYSRKRKHKGNDDAL